MKAETLKKSILQYAMQGKLVEQDPNDEPACELLKRIKAEKEKLIKEGKIKKEKPLPPITQDEIPYELPQGWEWVRLGEIFRHNTGKALNSKNVDGKKLSYITTSNLYWNYFILDNLREMCFSDTELEKCTVVKGDLLVLEGGDIGRAAIWNYDYSICIQNHIHRLRPYKTICTKFFYYLFLLYKLTNFIGGKGIGIQGLSSNAIHMILFPFPPLAEQQRIVEKLEQILPLVEEYGKNEEKLSWLNKTLPVKIKQSVLQHAIQGKLVLQNPTDEPACELLKRIKAEKEQLIKDGKIKKEKPLPPITQDEIPYELPRSWEWVRLGEICSKIVDGDHNPPSGQSIKTDYMMLSASNINNNKIIDLDKVRYLSKEVFDEENKRTKLKIDDILFTIVGTLGRSCIYDGKLRICFQRSVSVLTTLIYNKYLKTVLDSPYIQSFMQKNATGTAQKGFYLNQVSNLIIPLPPPRRTTTNC